MALTHKDVAEILKLIDESDVDELVIENDGMKIAITRAQGAGTADVKVAADADGAAAIPARQTAPDRAGKAEVAAPMAGVFYRKPSPEEPPFVELGDRVARGDALGLVEMMKLFTTVEAPAAGEIVEIVYDDAETVEQDAVLFVIAVYTSEHS